MKLSLLSRTVLSMLPKAVVSTLFLGASLMPNEVPAEKQLPLPAPAEAPTTGKYTNETPSVNQVKAMEAVRLDKLSNTDSGPSEPLPFTSEQRLTAALIYKLTSFVDFPTPSTPTVICFVGTSSLVIGEILETKIQQGMLKKSVEVIKEPALNNLRPNQCHIVYIAPTSRLQKEIVSKLSRNALTISNNDDFKNLGHTSSITFVDARPIISISKFALKQSNVELHSQLLNSITVKP